MYALRKAQENVGKLWCTRPLIFHCCSNIHLDTSLNNSSNVKNVSVHFSKMYVKSDGSIGIDGAMKQQSRKSKNNSADALKITLLEVSNNKSMQKEKVAFPVNRKTMQTTITSIMDTMKKTEQENAKKAFIESNTCVISQSPEADLINQQEIQELGAKKGAARVRKIRKSEHSLNKLKFLCEQREAAKIATNLDVYLEVCVKTNNLPLAWKYLMANKAANTASTSSFNIVMHGAFKEGDTQLVEMLKLAMPLNGVTLNALSYAIYLAALNSKALGQPVDKFSSNISLWSKESSPQNSLIAETVNKEISATLKTMEDECISLHDLFPVNGFNNMENDFLEGTLSAIRRILPEFVPESKYSKSHCDNPLVRRLYETDVRANLITPTSTPEKTSTPRLIVPGALDEQLMRELKGDVKIKNISSRAHENIQLEKLKLCWKDALRSALIKFIEQQQYFNHDDKKMSLLPFFFTVSVDELVNIIMAEIDRIAIEQETPVSSIALNLGKRLYATYVSQDVNRMGYLSVLREVYGKYINYYEANINSNMNSRLLLQSFIEEMCCGPEFMYRPREWPGSLKYSLGKVLYKIMKENIFIHTPVKSLAIFESVSALGYKTVSIVRFHEQLQKLYRSSSTLTFSVTDVPMTCPPLPWMAANFGSFFFSELPLIRLPSNIDRSLLNRRLNEVVPGQLDPIFDGLNVIGQTAWRVNSRVLDVLTEVFLNNSGADLDVPLHPDFAPKTDLPTYPQNADSDTVTSYYRAKLNARFQDEKIRKEMYSLWCEALYKISMANHFKDRVFWLPHNMDFRSRVYPSSPHMCHYSSDAYRALLKFAVSKPLTRKGLDWLKIHIINLTGLRKTEPFSERLKLCEELLPEILDSAERPLSGRRWWTKSDEPWQTLAACMELQEALQSPNPVEFESSLPVHQDGTCNGLQHYAALGRDVEGAISVNLAPRSSKQDVYVAVAKKVEEQRIRDATNVYSKSHRIACQLEGCVSRKVIKQTVMTTVYGVTFYGARLQIEKRLKELPQADDLDLKEASTYLARCTLGAIETMFASAKLLKEWLTACCDEVVKGRGQGIEWCTPLGLPVIQPYFRTEATHEQIAKLDEKTPLDQLNYLSVPNSLKHRNGLPPNFIHSLDASHMFLTALYCHHARLEFAAIHDCFWTHACSVDVLSKITREQFVALHKMPILEDLSKYFITIFASNNLSCPEISRFQSIPARGNFNINNVLRSTFFFS